MTDTDHLFKVISEIQAIAQNGLAYTVNEFDKLRFLRLRELAAELMKNYSQNSYSEITEAFSLEKGYATPKIDVRSFILRNNKLLLVKERSDGLWTLPGGWADINESPSEAIIRETKEETGFDVSAIKILALFDKLKHEHPHQWPHTYKCFFHCEITAGKETENLEISEIGFFNIDQLPDLSTPRVTKNQLLRLYDLTINSQQTAFD